MTTQNWQNPAPLDTEDLAFDGTEPAGTPSATSAAKHEAKGLAHEGAGAAKEVAATAASEAKNVAQEAGTQAKNLAGQLGTNLKDQAGAQQQKVAQGLRSIGDELRYMAQGTPDSSGTVAGLVEQAARRTEHAAGWLEDRDPGSLLQEVKDFARRRPGTFLAIAAGAGLLAGRLGRGLAGTQQQGTAPSPGPYTPAAAARPAPAEGLQAPVTAAVPAAEPAGLVAEPTVEPLGFEETAVEPVGLDETIVEPVGLDEQPLGEPTIAPGTPPQAIDPDRRLP